LSNLRGVFRIRFANRDVGVLRGIYWFLDGGRRWLGGGTKFDSGERRHIKLHAIQMPEAQEWKPDAVEMIFRSESHGG
jgi:hypothetical protein